MSMNNCPDPIELSSWHDGESKSDFQGHVAECPTCQESIDTYTRIDEVLQRPPDDGDDLKRRIMNACQCEDASRPVFTFVPLLRVAAGLILILAIGYSVLVDIRTEPTETASSEITNDAGSDAETPGDVEMELSSSRPGTEESYTLLVKRGNKIRALHGPRQVPFATQPSLLATHDIPRSQLVSTSPSSAGRDFSRNSSTMPVVLPRRIRHVWVVDNLAAGKENFLDKLPDGALCSVSDGKSGKDATSVSFGVELGEEQLQNLVNQLSASGWALVSSALPQPSELGRLLLTGETVSYICELVASD